MITKTTLQDDRVKFVSYDGKWPNLCRGTLVLNVNGKDYTWGEYSGFLLSGGAIEPNYEDVRRAEWEVDYSQIPDEIKEYATDTVACINANIPFGCCGGCI